MNNETKSLKGCNILVVDDSIDILMLVELFLKKAGARVVTATSRREALDHTRMVRYDAILMDLNMPEMDGIETTKVLRARGCETPIVAFTTDPYEKRSEASLKAGFTSHITKNKFRRNSTDELASYFLRGAKC